MSGFLVDTNVLSEFSRTRHPDRFVERWFLGADDSSLFISVLTIAELRRGIALLPAGKRQTDLQRWLEFELLPAFASPLLPVTHTVADRWAAISAQAQRQGKPRGVIDGLIAATALEHNLALVTRNVKHFEGLGIGIVNPWET